MMILINVCVPLNWSLWDDEFNGLLWKVAARACLGKGLKCEMA